MFTISLIMSFLNKLIPVQIMYIIMEEMAIYNRLSRLVISFSLCNLAMDAKNHVFYSVSNNRALGVKMTSYQRRSERCSDVVCWPGQTKKLQSAKCVMIFQRTTAFQNSRMYLNQTSNQKNFNQNIHNNRVLELNTSIINKTLDFHL